MLQRWIAALGLGLCVICIGAEGLQLRETHVSCLDSLCDVQRSFSRDMSHSALREPPKQPGCSRDTWNAFVRPQNVVPGQLPGRPMYPPCDVWY
eukprot:2347501-Rhodomonas_salina.3